MKDKNVLILKDVNYRYRDAQKDDYVLKNINYEFKKGKTYAIKGRSGSGKTTLAQILKGNDFKFFQLISLLPPYKTGYLWLALQPLRDKIIPLLLLNLLESIYI